MNNAKIAEKFEQLADLLEFQGSNPFRLRAYRNGARVIRDLGESVQSILEDPGRKLTDIDGIGKGVAEKSETLVKTGKLPQLEELLETVPKSVLDILRIPGLGPKKAAVLFQQLQVTNLEELKQACEQQKVRELDGFAAKSEKAILEGLEIAAAANQRIYWSEADTIAAELRKHFSECTNVKRLEFAGSYRRGKETVGDLDLLVDSTDHEGVMNRFAEFDEIASVIGRGETKMSVRLENGFQIDLRVVPTESFGAALQYFTGSKDHNVVIRSRARSRGLKINEWGVFDEKNDKYLAGCSEEEVYAAIGLPWFSPEIREARKELEWAEKDTLPELISEKDLQGDLHMHTTATDGKATLVEMIEAAQQMGHSYIAITDHSKRVSMANGLDEKRLLEQWSEIEDINQSGQFRIRVLKGIECDILEKGGMDLPDEILEQADWVLGAIHYGQNQPSRQITDRILGAIENPHVDCIAHPTGRLINRREAYEVSMDEVFEAASKNRKLLELNANPARLDLNDVFCALARSHGIPIAISTDAHSTRGLNVLRYGIKQARRAGLTRADVANTKSLKQLEKLLK
ncbi:MAG: DNA polymerase/3'-5' exonuclease PolX [Planctomycetota bacterium]|nr:DNA polymerase/3'-5' exonuclease PolX [Planctomycetota bacterium]